MVFAEIPLTAHHHRMLYVECQLNTNAENQTETYLDVASNVLAAPNTVIVVDTMTDGADSEPPFVSVSVLHETPKLATGCTGYVPEMVISSAAPGAPDGDQLPARVKVAPAAPVQVLLAASTGRMEAQIASTSARIATASGCEQRIC